MKRNSARTDFIWQSHETCRPIITKLKTQNRVFSFLFSSQNRIKSSSETSEKTWAAIVDKNKTKRENSRRSREETHVLHYAYVIFYIHQWFASWLLVGIHPYWADGIKVSVYRHPPACVIGSRVKFSLFQYFFIIWQICIASVSKIARSWIFWQILTLFIQLAKPRRNGAKDMADSSEASKKLKNRWTFSVRYIIFSYFLWCRFISLFRK
jgi:hypothetical protein